MEDEEILSAMKPYLKKINQALSQTVGETVLQLQGGGKENSTTFMRTGL